MEASESQGQRTPEQEAERRAADEKAAQEAQERAAQESPAVVDPSTGAEGPHQQAATQESSREAAEPGVTQGLVGDQGQWSSGQPTAVTGGSDPNRPVAQSPPPPASDPSRNVRVDEGVSEQASTLERSPQEFGAGGS